jgi:hypothetical protein
MNVLVNFKSWGTILKVFLVSIALIFFVVTLFGTYFLGFVDGYNRGILDTRETLISYTERRTESVISTPTPIQVVEKKSTKILPKAGWGGPELWEAVNQKRQEYGVNVILQKDELCTVASIRLNELLELGKLDGHEGFSNMTERRPDLKWIFDKYSVIAEFLAMGGESPEETVSLWDGTLGHKKLLTGGEYVWGCIYAQNTFAVAITAY